MFCKSGLKIVQIHFSIKIVTFNLLTLQILKFREICSFENSEFPASTILWWQLMVTFTYMGPAHIICQTNLLEPAT